jgi:hypothetical protein
MPAPAGSRPRPRNLGKMRDAKGAVEQVGRTIYYTSRAKVGGTAGWTVGAANNLGTLATQAAGTTNATLVVYLDGLKVGARIKGGHCVGQIESAGNTATFSWQLRKLAAAAADPVDSQVTVMASALSVTADAAVTRANSSIPAIDEKVEEGAVYYALVTSTTGASTDIQLLGVGLSVLEEPADL